MARVKFGSIIVEGSGSLGGHTIQKSLGGAQLRSKPINKKKPSAAQSLIRSYNPQLQAGWRSLSPEQQQSWNQFAISHQVRNKSGDGHILSGHSLYMRYAFDFISQGAALPTNPSDYPYVPVGPELIQNGGFTSDTIWSYGPYWSISDNKASYNPVLNNNIWQSANFLQGTSYRVKFSILDCPGTCVFRFLGPSGLYLFEEPYHMMLLSNGNYVITAIGAVDSNTFEIRGFYTYGSFSITNISVKEFL